MPILTFALTLSKFTDPAPVPARLRVRIRTHVPVFAAEELPFSTGHLTSPASVVSAPMATPDAIQCAWLHPLPAHW